MRRSSSSGRRRSGVKSSTSLVQDGVGEGGTLTTNNNVDKPAVATAGQPVMAIDGGQQQQSNNSTSVQSQHPQANGAYNNNNHHDNNTVPPVSSLFPAMRFSWEIKSVDAVFTNGSIGSSVGLGATKLTDLSKEAMLQAIIDQDMRFLSDDSNKTLLSEKKFRKETKDGYKFTFTISK